MCIWRDCHGWASPIRRRPHLMRRMHGPLTMVPCTPCSRDCVLTPRASSSPSSNPRRKSEAAHAASPPLLRTLKPSPGLLLLPRSAYTMPRPTPPHCLLGSTMWKRWFTSPHSRSVLRRLYIFCTQNPMKLPLMRPSPPTLISGSTMWKRWFTAPPHDDDSAAACALDGTCKLPAAASSSSPSPSPPVTSAAASGQQQHLSSSSVGPKKGTWSGYFFGK